MVRIPIEKYPKVLLLLGPLLFIGGMLLFSAYLSGAVQGIPQGFAVDARETLYTSDKRFLREIKNGEVTGERWDYRAHMPTVNENGELVLANDTGHVVVLALGEGENALETARIVTKYKEPENQTYNALRKSRRVATQGATAYRATLPYLRYQIERETAGERAVIYRMPTGDYLFQLLTIGIFITALILFVVGLHQGYQVYRALTPEERRALGYKE